MIVFGLYLIFHPVFIYLDKLQEKHPGLIVKAYRDRQNKKQMNADASKTNAIISQKVAEDKARAKEGK